MFGEGRVVWGGRLRHPRTREPPPGQAGPPVGRRRARLRLRRERRRSPRTQGQNLGNAGAKGRGKHHLRNRSRTARFAAFPSTTSCGSTTRRRRGSAPGVWPGIRNRCSSARSIADCAICAPFARPSIKTASSLQGYPGSPPSSAVTASSARYRRSPTGRRSRRKRCGFSRGGAPTRARRPF